MGFKKVEKHGGSIKSIKQGPSVTPKGLAPGQNAKTPQKTRAVVAQSGGGGKVSPKRG